MKTKEEIAKEVEAAFAEAEQAAAASGPGVLEVLKLFGDAQAAIRESELYLSNHPIEPMISDGNSSGI